MAVVYAVRNKVTGKVYIGCTAGKLNKRLREHKSMLNTGIHSSAEMQADFNAGGWEMFEGEVLEQLPEGCNVITKRAAELYWMQEFADRLYNCTQASFAPTPEANAKGVATAQLTASTRMTEQHQHAELKAARLSGLLTAENRASNSERQKERWKDPTYRAKRIEGLNRGREKTNTARKVK